MMEAVMTDEMRAAFESLIPQGEMGRPEEIATAALFLASDDSSYINGQEVVADGGTTVTDPSKLTCSCDRARRNALPGASWHATLVGVRLAEQLAEQTERNSQHLRPGVPARILGLRRSRTGSCGLGAGRSQVQILSPRLTEGPPLAPAGFLVFRPVRSGRVRSLM
jgi:hypothetical protein